MDILYAGNTKLKNPTSILLYKIIYAYVKENLTFTNILYSHSNVQMIIYDLELIEYCRVLALMGNLALTHFLID